MPCYSDVTELATLAKDGDKGAQNALWHAVKSWAFSVAMQYLPYVQASGAWSSDDLEQCAGLGVLGAVQTYEPDKGSFLNWCSYYIKKECRVMLGLVGRIRKEHYNAARLDEPIPGTEDLTRLDLIEDETATDRMEAVEDRAWNDALREDLRQAMSKIQERDRQAIQGFYLDGLTLQQTADRMGVKTERVRQCRNRGLRALRQDGRLYVLYSPNYSRHKGISAFRTTFSSVVEDEAIKHMDFERRTML